MDPVTAVIGILILGLFALPFVLDHRSRKRKQEMVHRELQQLARAHNGRIDQQETCGQSTIGLDDANNLLFHLAQRAGGMETSVVHLAEMRSCKASHSTSNTQGQPGSAILYRVELCLQPKLKGKADTCIELYRQGPDTHLNGELQFAEKWAKLLNQRP